MDVVRRNINEIGGHVQLYSTPGQGSKVRIRLPLTLAILDGQLARVGKVVLLPHMGSATLEGRVDMGEKVIVNIKTFADGHKPPDRVIPAML